MKLNELIKRIIDTCNYNEMNIDTDLSLDYICMITPPLVTKDFVAITENIIYPLMDQYRDSEDKDELEYIQDTILLVNQFLSEKE